MALLRHLALRCRDVEVSRRFYEEAIGFRFIDYRSPNGDGSLDLTDGTLNITLLPYKGLDRPLRRGTNISILGFMWMTLKGLGIASKLRGHLGSKRLRAEVILIEMLRPT